jgi:FkbM family methyltransferase
MNLRAGGTYEWFRYRVPAPLRRVLKAVPGVSGVAESARPRGDLWLPVKLAPGLERSMLLPEAFHWISYDGYEPQPLRWIAANVNRGDTCLDVGGHIGVFSVLMAELVGTSGSVHTFEPFPPSLNIARKTMERNRLADRVTMTQAAVDEMDGGTVELFIGEGTSEASLYGHETRTTTIAVPRISLDAYADRAGLDRIDVIKMDIEGAEERALRGAISVLERHSPALLLEVHGRKAVGSIEILGACGYRITSFQGERVSAETFPDSILQVVATRDA